MINSYEFGNDVTCIGVFRNAADVFADPSAVFCKIKDPAGTVTIYTYGTDDELIRDSAGNYHLLVDANLAGEWFYRFYSLGTGKAADENSFIVSASEF